VCGIAWQWQIQGKPDTTTVVVSKVASGTEGEPAKHVTYFSSNFHTGRYITHTGTLLGAPELDYLILSIDLEDQLNNHLPFDTEGILKSFRQSYCLGLTTSPECYFTNQPFVEYMELIARISLAEDEPARAPSFMPEFISRAKKSPTSSWASRFKKSHQQHAKSRANDDTAKMAQHMSISTNQDVL
jgi:hypothetical protein